MEKIFKGREVKLDEKNRVSALYSDVYGWLYPYIWSEKMHCWTSVPHISKSTFYRWMRNETSIKWN